MSARPIFGTKTLCSVAGLFLIFASSLSAAPPVGPTVSQSGRRASVTSWRAQGKRRLLL